MKRLFSLLLIPVLFICLFACKKDEEKKPDRAALITAKSWKISSISAPPLPDNDPRVLSALGALGNSDVKFNSNGTYVATDRSTKATETGTWEFNSDQTQLITDKGQPNSFTFKVDLLTATNLDLNTVYNYVFGGVTIPVTVNLKLIPA